MNPLKWMLPPQSSNFAGDSDWLFYFITWISIFFFVLILFLMIYFIVRYRRKSPHDPAGEGPEHHLPLEITWSVIPLILVILMFYWGMVGANEMATPPANTYDIDVTARQWSWEFTYPIGESSNILHVWAGQPILLRMTSMDVLHAFFVPQFRVKNDIVPKKISTVWFICNTPGDYPIFCAEYCGTSHSKMISTVRVHATREEFEVELAKEFGPPPDYKPAMWGVRLHEKKGCKQCHTIQKVPAGPQIGPSWRELSQMWGTPRRFTDGSKQIVDETYIRESIQSPGKKFAENYGPAMPPTNLKDRDIDAIIAFIKVLKDLPPDLKDSDADAIVAFIKELKDLPPPNKEGMK